MKIFSVFLLSISAWLFSNLASSTEDISTPMERLSNTPATLMDIGIIHIDKDLEKSIHSLSGKWLSYKYTVARSGFNKVDQLIMVAVYAKADAKHLNLAGCREATQTFINAFDMDKSIAEAWKITTVLEKEEIKILQENTAIMMALEERTNEDLSFSCLLLHDAKDVIKMHFK